MVIVVDMPITKVAHARNSKMSILDPGQIKHVCARQDNTRVVLPAQRVLQSEFFCSAFVHP